MCSISRRPLIPTKGKFRKCAKNSTYLLLILFLILLCILTSMAIYFSSGLANNLNKITPLVDKVDQTINKLNDVISIIEYDANLVKNIGGKVDVITNDVRDMMGEVEEIVDNSVFVSTKVKDNIDVIINDYYQGYQKVIELIDISLSEYPLIESTLNDVKELIKEIEHFINSTSTNG